MYSPRISNNNFNLDDKELILRELTEVGKDSGYDENFSSPDYCFRFNKERNGRT